MKILMVTNKVRTYALGFQNVLTPLLQLGHEIVWAADFSQFVGEGRERIPCVTEQISIHTSPFHPENRKAYRQIRRVIREHKIEAVLCSTPIGGLLARLAAHREGVRPVVYTAHGFLFFKGAPLINQTAYKWEEELLAHITDALITIALEDYSAAKKLKLRNGGKLYLIHGAGIQVGVRADVDRAEKRRSLGVPDDAFLVVSVGELNRNKNTATALNALIEMNDSRVHYVACGDGPEKRTLEMYAQKRGVSERFHAVGYRTDVSEILACSDAFVMMSFREGLPRALMEAMDAGLPCVGSDTRGIRDLIDSEGGFICKPKDAKGLSLSLWKLFRDPALRERMGAHNCEKVKRYASEVVRRELYGIFKEVFP